MVYDSTISFTLDTICPWTYLAKKRLEEALEQFRESEQAKDVNFTVVYKPYQLYPKFSKEGVDKYDWYMNLKYNGEREKMIKYETLMKMYGGDVGIRYKFHGTVANTFDAHRLIQFYQEEKGPQVADAIVSSLYSQYFENEQHPSSDATLLKAAVEAGIPEAEAKAFIEDRSEYKMDTEAAVREQTHNGIDSVPYIVFEGKRRDITVEGAQEIQDYMKAMASIVKESK